MGTAGRLYDTQTPAWVLTKLALSAMIHPHPLGLAHSAVCERGPVRNTELPHREHRRCHPPTPRDQVHGCKSICWLPGALPGDRVASHGQGVEGEAGGTTSWGHTALGSNSSSATSQLGDLWKVISSPSLSLAIKQGPPPTSVNFPWQRMAAVTAVTMTLQEAPSSPDTPP